MTVHIKGGLVGGNCAACGHTSDLDNKHRLATYIIKNPPIKSGGEFDK